MENNSEHWHALYLSLRELADWAAKKELELENMGPIGGDDVTIKKQQVNKSAVFVLICKLCVELFNLDASSALASKAG